MRRSTIARLMASTLPAFALLLSSPVVAQTTSEDVYEKQFVEGVSAQNIGDYIKTLTVRPTYPGSPFSKPLAQKTLELFKSFGWDAKIETFYVDFPKPTEQRVELLGENGYVAKLKEEPIPGDDYTFQTDEILGVQFIYGPDGDVTAPLVYANFGLRDDYKKLATMGVDVRGKIVIARIGGMWRGGKVQLAAEHGAVGILLYSDPKEDGYARDDTYPEGSGRPPSGVQRGSVLYGIYNGDPLTPGVAATKDAKRISPTDPNSSVAKIPAVPLSYEDAQQFLKALGGQVVPESWRGALPVTYHSGPSAAPVRLKVKYDWKQIELYDVIARLKGDTFPDELVIRGNHRDGWVFGAHDPHAGHASLLEEARVMGELYRKGWRPKRTLVYASWDAEEQGTIGSNEWVEAHRKELLDHAVVYMNTDASSQNGPVSVSGSASLGSVATSVASSLKDPQSNVSLLERAKIEVFSDLYENPSTGGYGVISAGSPRVSFDQQNNSLPVGAPGYGSDHHSFVSYLSVPTLNLGFSSRNNSGGSYHTMYDNYDYYARFQDPGFKYGKAHAELNGVAAMRMASFDVLPMEFKPTAEAVAREISQLKSLYTRLRTGAERTNAMIDLNAYRVVQDPARPLSAPSRQTVPNLDFSPLEEALARLQAASEHFTSAKANLPAKLSKAQVAAVNRQMILVEQAFRREDGLPGRELYKNEFFSPGRLWDTVPVPAVGDAMLDGKWTLAAQQIPLAANTVGNIAARVEAATSHIAWIAAK